MQPPQEPFEPDVQREDIEREFSLSLEDVERSLVALKQRYAQVQNDRQRQAELQQRLKQVKKELRNNHLPQLKVELKQIKEQIEALEINLESQLFSWGSLQEPFWQAVRFGGLGFVVGWILKSCAG
jgi:hypothetical protein